MKDLDDNEQMLERSTGLISGMMIYMLWEESTAAGSLWNMSDPKTMEIIVTKVNAAQIYSICKEVRSGYSIGITKDQMKKIKNARSEAHKLLYEEANDPNTTIERKIELVKLTSKE